jgi:D-glycero-D-manno-heptose 1,7-bisphosphate phosphatase
MNSRKPIFLDRDGVLNVDLSPYVSSADDLQLLPGTVDALRRLDEAGFDAYVISNQQGVSLGITPPEALPAIDAKIQRALEPYGVRIKRFYYCTSLDSVGDPCRKPSPGMIFKARDEFGLDLDGAFVVGDKGTDVECAIRAGCRPLLVLTGVTREGEWEDWDYKPEKVFPNLLAAVDYIVATGIPDYSR